MNRLYTVQEVADRLKIKKNTVYELIKRGELSSSKIGKQLRITEEQLSDYLTASAQSGAAPALTPKAFPPESSLLKRDYLIHSNGLIISGQTSTALDLLLSQLTVHEEGLPALQSHMNTYNGLYSLYFEKVHVASASLPLSDVRALIPGIPLAAVCLYEYPMGFFVKKGNPKGIHTIGDLRQNDVILANREKGSTRRIFLDKALLELQISPSEISGYHNELVSDLSTAASVACGKADAAIGEESVARQCPDLDFLPLIQYPFYLIMEAASVERPGFSALLQIVRSEDFKAALAGQTGYDTVRTGTLEYI